MTFEEIQKENDELMKRHDEIMKMSKEDFLKEETGKELEYIHKRSLELVRRMNNK